MPAPSLATPFGELKRAAAPVAVRAAMLARRARERGDGARRDDELPDRVVAVGDEEVARAVDWRCRTAPLKHAVHRPVHVAADGLPSVVTAPVAMTTFRIVLLPVSAT